MAARDCHAPAPGRAVRRPHSSEPSSRRAARHDAWRILAPTRTTEVVIGSGGAGIKPGRPVPGEVLSRLTYQAAAATTAGPARQPGRPPPPLAQRAGDLPAGRVLRGRPGSRPDRAARASRFPVPATQHQAVPPRARLPSSEQASRQHRNADRTTADKRAPLQAGCENSAQSRSQRRRHEPRCPPGHTMRWHPGGISPVRR
jgi:hypothetical protein